MDTFSKNQSANRRLPNEVLGLDLGCAAVKAVRLRNGKEGLSVVAAEILPPINRKPGDALPSLELPPKLVTNYAAVTFSSSQPSLLVLLPST